VVARTRDEIQDSIEKAVVRLQRFPEIVRVRGIFRDSHLSHVHL